MIGFWDFIAQRAPPLLSGVVRPQRVLTVDAERKATLDLLIAALKTANVLIRHGHTAFWCFGVGLRPDGCHACFVSNEADFVPILAAQPQTLEPLSSAVVAVGPSMTTENLNANRLEGAEDDWGYEETLIRLQELAAAGEIIASALVMNGLDGCRSDDPQQVVDVELEHKSGWSVLYSQPYSLNGGTFQVGEASQFEHEPVVFTDE